MNDGRHFSQSSELSISLQTRFCDLYVQEVRNVGVLQETSRS
jgi:hypothetical protein